jgi:hypothetical protein
MKNIHLLPTDKPSRLSILNTGKLNFGAEFISSSNSKAQHIYIIDDSEIKDVRPHKGKWQLEGGLILNKLPDYLTDLSECKLIIMTTDPELIKDGVQPIDNTFLEWFINNSSCKSVKIESWQTKGEWELEYKIIIPKEEPKQSTVGKEFYESADKIITVYKQDITQLIEDRILSEYKKHSASLPDEWAKIAAYKIYKSISDKMEEPKQHVEFINNNIEEFDESLKSFKQKQYLIDMMIGDEELGLYNEPKQETIEETAENYSQKYSQKVGRKYGFMDGAEYQAKGMYSKEEVRKLLETQRGNCAVAILIKTRDEELAAIAGGAPEPSGYNGWVK